jgi:hypothetical protein
MATIGRLHYERLTDRVPWPKREIAGNAAPDMQVLDTRSI